MLICKIVQKTVLYAGITATPTPPLSFLQLPFFFSFLHTQKDDDDDDDKTYFIRLFISFNIIKFDHGTCPPLTPSTLPTTHHPYTGTTCTPWI